MLKLNYTFFVRLISLLTLLIFVYEFMFLINKKNNKIFYEKKRFLKRKIKKG